MKKGNKKILIVIALIIIIAIAFTSNVYALNPNDYNPGGLNTIGTESFLDKAGTVVGLIKNIGIIVSIIVLLIIGIKYIFGSVEAKADYKKTMLPYVVGCAMLMGTSIIVGIILEIAQ